MDRNGSDPPGGMTQARILRIVGMGTLLVMNALGAWLAFASPGLLDSPLNLIAGGICVLVGLGNFVVLELLARKAGGAGTVARR